MKKALCIFISLAIGMSLMVPAFADKLTEVQNQKKTVDKKISDLNKEKKSQEQKLKSVKEQKEEIEAAQKQEQQKYDKLVSEIEELKRSIAELDKSIEASEKEYNEKLELLKVRLRVMYENSDYTYIDTLAQSKSVIDFFERLELMSTISKKDKEIVESIKQAKQDIEYKKQLVVGQKEQVQLKADESLKTIGNLSATRASLDDQIKEINTRLKKI